MPLSPNGVSHSRNLSREERAERICCECNSIVRGKLGQHCGEIKVSEMCFLLFFHQRTPLWLFHSPLKSISSKLYYHCIQYLDSKMIREDWMSYLRMLSVLASVLHCSEVEQGIQEVPCIVRLLWKAQIWACLAVLGSYYYPGIREEAACTSMAVPHLSWFLVPIMASCSLFLWVPQAHYSPWAHVKGAMVFLS